MPEHLESARYTLANARRHLENLKREIRAFLETKPYGTVTEFDTDGIHQLHKVKLTKPLPVGLAGLGIDCVCNLRAVLDQVGYAVAAAAGGRTKNTYFPVGDTPAEVRNRRTGGSADIPDKIFDLMVGFEPHKTGNIALWALGKLSNTNKHRFFVPMATAMGGTTHVNTMVIKGGTFGFSAWDSEKNEMTLARTDPDGQFNYDMEFKFFIALGEIVPNIPADVVLDRMASEVERVLVAVEAEAIRLGIFQ